MSASSPQLEREILGSILLNETCYYQAAEELVPDDFSLDDHRRIYRAMLALDANAQAIDTVTVIESLRQSQSLDGIGGGAAYVIELTSGLPRPQNIHHYVSMLKELSNRKRLMAVCEATTGALFDGGALQDSLARLEETILEIQSGATKQAVVPASECADRAYENMVNPAGGGLSYGLSELDGMTGGIREHYLVVVGGRPGQGKSSLACQIVTANCKAGVPVLLFTAEMQREQVIQRIYCGMTGVNASKARMGFLSQNDRDALHIARVQVGEWPLYLDDGNMSISQIVARTKLAIKQHGIKLVVVDYVQIIEARSTDPRIRVSNISEGLRSLAKDYCPVVALSQMPRPRSDDLNKWPTMYDLKESGSLEADATTILMIYRETHADTKLPNGNDVIVIPKQRYGTTGSLNVTFDNNSLLFRPRDVFYGSDPQ